MNKQSIKIIAGFLFAAAAFGAGTGAASAAGRSVSLTQEPVVMRLSNDEFRIAFGIDGEKCGAKGCNGVILYRVQWKADDGALREENKQVSYSVAPNSNRTITVDRAYFHTAEGRHTTDVVGVKVRGITCVEGAAIPL